MAENTTTEQETLDPEKVLNPTNAMPEGEQERVFTQAELDAIITKRLSDEASKAAAERAQYQRDIAEREAYIHGLMQNAPRGQQPPQEPQFETQEEAYLYRANRAASAEFEKKLEAQTLAVQTMLAPLVSGQHVEQFFSVKPAQIPAEVKARTAELYKANMMRGATVEGAYKLAVAEYGERVMLGQAPNLTAPTAQPNFQPQPARAPLPHVEMGGGNRRIVPQPGAQKEFGSLSDFFAEAAKVNQYAPEDGAVYGTNGAAPYRKP